MNDGREGLRNRWPPEGLSWSSGSPSEAAPGTLACWEVNTPQWCGMARVALAWSSFIWGRGCSPQRVHIAHPPIWVWRPSPSQHLPWVAEVTRTVVTQRLQRAAAKRAMARARDGNRDLSGLWGGPCPASPGHHGLAHQPGGGQGNDTGQGLTAASTEGVCRLLMVRPLLGFLSQVALTRSGPSSPVQSLGPA